jgi:hypothetical protein
LGATKQNGLKSVNFIHMNAFLVSPGIRFNDCLFSEPKHLGGWVSPRYAGIFVILVEDPNWAPKPYRALVFGEFGNNAREMLQPQDQIRLAGVSRAETLLVSVLPMPFSTTAQRAALCNELIWAYNPVCQANGATAAPSELARKLEELEKRHEEQTTHLHLLLANINKLFEPLPERPRRQIGFVPRPVTAA